MTIPFCLAEISQNEWNETRKSVTSPPFLGGEFNTHGHMLDSQLIASPEGKVKRANFPTWGWRRSIYPIAFTTRFHSVSAHCRQAEAKRTPPEPCVHSDHYCVEALRITARTKAHALSAHTQPDMQWYTCRSTQNHTGMQDTGSGDVELFPTMQCGNGPLVACHWWRYTLWIHRIEVSCINVLGALWCSGSCSRLVIRGTWVWIPLSTYALIQGILSTIVSLDPGVVNGYPAGIYSL